MRFNDLAPNGFGVRSYMLAQALQFDWFICCFPFNLTYGPLLSAFSQDFAIRLGSPINAVQVSNSVIDAMELMQAHTVSCAHADLTYVSDCITRESVNSPIPLFNAVGDNGEGLFLFLYDLLGSQIKRSVNQ